MTKKFLAAILAASLAMTAVSTAPARALDRDHTAKLIIGVGTLFALAHAFGQNKRSTTRHVNRNYNHNYQPRPRHPSNAIVVPSHCVHGHGHNRWVDWNCARRSGY